MDNYHRYFLYARKSTDVEDKQVRSIDAQLTELRELASRCGLHIVSELIEKESAKMPGARSVFNEMLSRIAANEADAIITWHPDRLARNPMDGSCVIGLLDSGKLKRIQFHGSVVENTPQGKMVLTIEFGFSKYYIDALSENTKRGHREKVRRGEYPSIAPLGYLNDRRVKRIAIDRERAPVVREAFERYATGGETLQGIREFFNSRGVRTRNGHMLCRAHVSGMLSNPLYYGHFNWGGELHEGVHTPIVSKELFDAVQLVFQKRWRYSPAQNKSPQKPFLGLLRCGQCGGSITGEVQKGHTYYRCTKKLRSKSCSERYLRGEALESQISALLQVHQLPKGWAEDMLQRLENERRHSEQAAEATLREKRAQVETINLRLERLTAALIDALIDHQAFRSTKAKLLSQKKSLEEEMGALAKGRLPWLEPFRKWILAAQTLGNIAATGSETRKATLAKEVFGSNLVLSGQKAHGRAVEPWSLIGENGRGDTSVTLYYRARTRFQKKGDTI